MNKIINGNSAADMTYTLQQIKSAFWLEFHESGELWFPYINTHCNEGRCEEVTQSFFDDFIEKLEGATDRTQCRRN